MELINLKIRGDASIPDTGWLTIRPGINLLAFSEENRLLRFVSFAESINPLIDVNETRPFAGVSNTTMKNGHFCRVRPEKRTAAMAVFNSAPPLVEELARISHLFYETDRIEVGRRLDYSRWINFVELAASTRWSEIAEPFSALLAQYPDQLQEAATLTEIVEKLKPTDRIKGELMEQMIPLLTSLSRQSPPNPIAPLTQLLEGVKRPQFFASARAIVEKRLPPIVLLDRNQPHPSRSLEKAIRWYRSQSATDESQAGLVSSVNRQLRSLFPRAGLRIEAKSGGLVSPVFERAASESSVADLADHGRLAVSVCQVTHGVAPILLFNISSLGHDRDDGQTFVGQLADVAEQAQCICAFREGAGFPGEDDASVVYPENPDE